MLAVEDSGILCFETWFFFRTNVTRACLLALVSSLTQTLTQGQDTKEKKEGISTNMKFVWRHNPARRFRSMFAR